MPMPRSLSRALRQRGRSARACAKLSQVDFPRLYNLTGGIHAWIKAGEPVVKQ